MELGSSTFFERNYLYGGRHVSRDKIWSTLCDFDKSIFLELERIIMSTRKLEESWMGVARGIRET